MFAFKFKYFLRFFFNTIGKNYTNLRLIHEVVIVKENVKFANAFCLIDLENII